MKLLSSPFIFPRISAPMLQIAAGMGSVGEQRRSKEVTFLTLKDETGFVNVVVWQQVYAKHTALLRTATFLGVTGTMQVEGEVVHLVARTLWTSGGPPGRRLRPEPGLPVMDDTQTHDGEPLPRRRRPKVHERKGPRGLPGRTARVNITGVFEKHQRCRADYKAGRVKTHEEVSTAGSADGAAIGAFGAAPGRIGSRDRVSGRSPGPPSPRPACRFSRTTQPH